MFWKKRPQVTPTASFNDLAAIANNDLTVIGPRRSGKTLLLSTLARSGVLSSDFSRVVWFGWDCRPIYNTSRFYDLSGSANLATRQIRNVIDELTLASDRPLVVLDDVLGRFSIADSQRLCDLILERRLRVWLSCEYPDDFENNPLASMLLALRPRLLVLGRRCPLGYQLTFERYSRFFTKRLLDTAYAEDPRYGLVDVIVDSTTSATRTQVDCFVPELKELQVDTVPEIKLASILTYEPTPW